jgi:hypothetical protein
MDQDALQALIAKTEALGWDNPEELVAHDSSQASQRGFGFIGKLLGPKTHNPFHVRSTLSSVWSFAAPLVMEVMDSNKFLFTVPHESHYQSIINQGPWNVKGSLLLLQPWSPTLAIDEVKLQYCAFWIQVHKLPLQYMTTKNAIKIGKAIGPILELDNNNTSGLICHQFIRFKIEIDITKPLAPGFYMPCPGEKKPCWIAFMHERLDEYCTSCGLIGHIKKFCPTPPQPLYPPDKYSRSLRAPPYVSPRLVLKIQQEDSDSGISSAASVGNSPRSMSSSHIQDSSDNNLIGLVPVNVSPGASPSSSSNSFCMQHVDTQLALVQTQPAKLLQPWDIFTHQPYLGHPVKGTFSNILPL